MNITIGTLLLAGCVGSSQAEQRDVSTSAAHPETPKRVVAVGPGIAQIVQALAPGSLVAVDAASATIEGLEELPSIGFPRSVQAEGLLSVAPDLVLTTERAGPPVAFQQVEGAGTKVVRVSSERTVDGVRQLTREVADALGADPAALLETFEASCGSIPKLDRPVRALFIYARSGGVVNVSGTDTSASAMMTLAGLENAVTAYEGYKPLTPEAALTVDPDVLLFTTQGLEALGGPEGVASIPGLALTEAAKAGRIATVDDLQLLAFGLDTCNGARALVEAVR